MDFSATPTYPTPKKETFTQKELNTYQKKPNFLRPFEKTDRTAHLHIFSNGNIFLTCLEKPIST